MLQSYAMLAPACIPFRFGRLTGYFSTGSGCPHLEAFVQSLPAHEPVIWLDSARHHRFTGRWSLVGYRPWLTCRALDGAIEVRTSEGGRVWRDAPLQRLRQLLTTYRGSLELMGPRSRLPDGAHAPLPRAIGLMGFLSYEMHRSMERLPSPPTIRLPAVPSIPRMSWFGMRVVVLVDHLTNRHWLVSLADPHRPRRQASQEAIDALSCAQALLRAHPFEQSPVTLERAAGVRSGQSWRGLQLEATSTKAEFEAMVCRVLEHIRAGDIFQANITQRFTATWNGAPFALYQTLRRANPSPFSCYLRCEDLAVISCSPERLVSVDGERVGTRPIAGTRPRGSTPEDDAINSFDLLMSEKERAEHIMLVDLARNDLGRVCVSGTVGVGELMGLEEYSHVIHIVSDVSGRLRPDVDSVDVIRAVFPGGTITGCPKIRCMEIVQEVEPCERGLYTGSVGYLGFDGTMDLNIAIRTIVMSDNRLSFHAGAGIVADSSPEREYEETLAKAGALVDALHAVNGRGSDPEAMNVRSHGAKVARRVRAMVRASMF